MNSVCKGDLVHGICSKVKPNVSYFEYRASVQLSKKDAENFQVGRDSLS